MYNKKLKDVFYNVSLSIIDFITTNHNCQLLLRIVLDIMYWTPSVSPIGGRCVRSYLIVEIIEKTNFAWTLTALSVLIQNRRVT